MELLDNGALRTSKTDFKKQVRRYARRWPWFLLTLVLLFVAVGIYLRYAETQYQTLATLRFQPTDTKPTMQVLSDLNKMGVSVSNDDLEAETSVIVSKPILMKVVNDLNLNVQYFYKGSIKEVPVYRPKIEAKIISFKSADNFGGKTYTLTNGKNGAYTLTTDAGTVPIKGLYGEILDLGWGKVQISNNSQAKDSQELIINFRNPDQVVSSLQRAITVVIDKKELMNLTLVGPLPEQSKAILADVIQTYNEDGIKNKNQQAEVTAQFINDRLSLISHELSDVENQKVGFQEQNNLVDIQAQGQLTLHNISDNTKEALNQAAQLDLIQSIEHLAQTENKMLPSGLGLDGGLQTSIENYNNLLLTRDRTLKDATPQNPAVIQMNKQIEAMHAGVLSSLKDASRAAQQKLSDLEGQINLEKGKVQQLPGQSMIFRGIDRQQNLRETLYLFLLQKREENAMSMAAQQPKATIVNPPYTGGVKSPKTQILQYGALGLGLILPFLFFYARDLLDTKVHEAEDVKNVFPQTHILSEIPFTFSNPEIVDKSDLSVYAESYRILTSNLRFLLKGKRLSKSPVLLVTSSMKGEGKTTVSVNMAAQLAVNASVLLIGADLRNRQLLADTRKTQNGLSDYLASDDDDLMPYLEKGRMRPTLDILHNGTRVPNPTELLDLPKFSKMINAAKQKYDYIIIDSAPVMLVSDTLHLLQVSDWTLYTIRAEKTDREMLNFARNFKEENNLKNFSIVLNGIRNSRSKYIGGYYGKYGDETITDKPWWKRIFGN